MATVGKLVVELLAETASFHRDMSKAASTIGSTASQINKDIAKIQRGFRGLTSAIGVAVGAAGFAMLGKSVIDTTARFEQLRVSLATVTGSTETAAAAFNMLQGFAAKTPFQLEEVITAFTRLRAMGLDPSSQALTAYGNTASAMGKSLMQMVEAVADAATGEFERLKEFGIRASSQGDRVTFTFKGVSTTVQKSADQIEQYLQRIGAIEFAGGMEAQSRTLAGAFSNLQDSTSRLFDAIGSGNASGVLGTLSREVSGVVDAITENIQANKDAERSYDGLTSFIRISAFTVFKLKNAFVDLGDQIGATMAIIGGIGPGFKKNMDAILEARREFQAKMEQQETEFVARMEGIQIGEKQGTQPDFRGKAGGNGGGKGGPTTSGGGGSDRDLFADYTTDLMKSVEATREALKSEEQLLRESYERRTNILLEANMRGLLSDQEFQAMQLALKAQHEQAILDIEGASYEAWRERTAVKFETLMESMATENELLSADYATKQMLLEDALMAELLTEQEYKAQREQLETAHQAKLGSAYHQGLLQRQKFTQMSYAEQTKTVIGSMIQMTQGVAQSNKTMFKINKAAGIANAVVSTYQGVAHAIGAYPPPISIAMAAIQLAAGLAQVQKIKSASFGGGAVSGGGIPSGPAPSPVYQAQPPFSATNAVSAEQEKPQREVNITLVGSAFDARTIRDELIPLINDAHDDGVKIRVSSA